MMELEGKKKKKAVGKNDGKDVNSYASYKVVIATEQPNHMLLKNPSHTHAKAYETFSVRLGFMSEVTPMPSGLLEFLIMQILSGFYTLTGILCDLDGRNIKAECWEGGE